MRLVPKPPEIGPENGFEGNDIFGYEEFGKNLARIVESLEGPAVIALDGSWGTGKTTFARQSAGLLRQRGSAMIEFDAFSVDHGEERQPQFGSGSSPVLDICRFLDTLGQTGDSLVGTKTP